MAPGLDREGLIRILKDINDIGDLRGARREQDARWLERLAGRRPVPAREVRRARPASDVDPGVRFEGIASIRGDARCQEGAGQEDGEA